MTKNIKKIFAVLIFLFIFLTNLNLNKEEVYAATINTVTSTSGTATYVNGNYTYEFTYNIGDTSKITANTSNICNVTKITCGGAATNVNLNQNLQTI